MEKKIGLKKPIVIVIGGPGASGSSTISKLLANHFGLERVYGGQVMRDLAVHYGYTDFNQFLEYLRDNPDKLQADQQLDKTLEGYAKRGNVVIESKSFAGYSTKNNIVCSVKIWLTADIDTRVKRSLLKEGKDINNIINTSEEYEKIKEELEKRYMLDKDRYLNVYGIDYDNPQLYNDIVLDTSRLNEQETLNTILSMIYIEEEIENTGEQYEVKSDTNPEDLDMRWIRTRCLVCNYLYEGNGILKKCPRCNNEDMDKFEDVD